MRVETIILRVGVPDANGRIWSREALEAIAKEDPTKYKLDAEGNLRQFLNDHETQQLENLLVGTPAEGMSGNEGLEKFQQVLKYRADKNDND